MFILVTAVRNANPFANFSYIPSFLVRWVKKRRLLVAYPRMLSFNYSTRICNISALKIEQFAINFIHLISLFLYVLQIEREGISEHPKGVLASVDK